MSRLRRTLWTVLYPRVLRRVNATWVGFRFLTRPMAPRTLWGILTLGQEPDVSGVSLVPARGVALGAIGTGLRVPVRLGSVLCIMRPLGTRQRVGESAGSVAAGSMRHGTTVSARHQGAVHFGLQRSSFLLPTRSIAIRGPFRCARSPAAASLGWD